MNERIVDVKIISIPDCPACVQMLDMVEYLVENNEFLNLYVADVIKTDPYLDEHKEFPIFQIVDHSTQEILYEAVGCYSRSTVMWKLIKWIVPNGK